MLSMSKWMIGFGVLLIGVDLIDTLSALQLGLAGGTLLCGWLGGALMIVAGFAASQGRRSLRLTGIYTGVFLPLILAAIFVWRAAGLWRDVRSPAHAPMPPAVGASALALLSILLVAIISRVRPREGIASRGYAGDHSYLQKNHCRTQTARVRTNSPVRSRLMPAITRGFNATHQHGFTT